MSLFPCYGQRSTNLTLTGEGSSSSSLREKRAPKDEDDDDGKDKDRHQEKKQKREHHKREKEKKDKKYRKERDKKFKRNKGHKDRKKEKAEKKHKKKKVSSSRGSKSLIVREDNLGSDSSSSNLDTSSDDGEDDDSNHYRNMNSRRKQLQVMNTVASSFGCEPVFLPNGQIVIKEKSDKIGNLSYEIDRLGDLELLIVSTYRLEIPKYTLSTGVSSEQLARAQDVLRITTSSSSKRQQDSAAQPDNSTMTVSSSSSKSAARYCNLKRKDVSSLFKTNIGILRFEDVRQKRHEKAKIQEKGKIQQLQSSMVLFDTNSHLQQQPSLFGSNLPVIPLPLHIDVDKMIAGGDDICIRSDSEMHASYLRMFNKTIGSLRDVDDWQAVVAAQTHVVRHQLRSLGVNHERRLREQKISQFDQRVLERSINFIREALSSDISDYDNHGSSNGNGNGNGNNSRERMKMLRQSDLYCHLLNLLEAMDSEDKVSQVYRDAALKCNTEIYFIRNYLQFTFRLFSPNSLERNRNKYEEISRSFINSIINEVAAENMIAMENDDYNIDNKSSNSNDNVQMSKLLYCRRSEIELLFDYINMELEYGYTERVIAIIQAIIEFNSSNPHTAAVMPPTLAVEGNINDESDCWDLQDFSEYWDSEYARVGDVGMKNEEVGDSKWLGFQKWRGSGRPSDGWTQGGFFYPLKDVSFGDNDNDILVEMVSTYPKFDMSMYHYHEGQSNEDNTTFACDNNYGGMSGTYYYKDNDKVGPIGSEDSQRDYNEERSGWVYSIVHGRRIDMTEKESSINLYRRILSEMAGENDDDDDDDDENHKHSTKQSRNNSSRNSNPTSVVTTKRQEKVEMISREDSVLRNWNEEKRRSIYEWRPLRATDEQDESLVEQTPDRVILYTDISSYVVEFGSCPSVRLLFVHRALEALGVVTPLSYTRQNSTIRQNLDPFKGALEAFIDYKDCCTSTCRMGREGGVVTQYFFGRCKEMMSLYYPQQWWSMHFSESVITSHYSDHKIDGINSKMTFTIRLLEGIVENSFIGDKSINNELMCGLISLITHQYIICRENKDATTASLMEKVKTIAEGSVKDTNISSPHDDDVRVWCAYVNTLMTIDAKKEATIVCDQTLAAICKTCGGTFDFNKVMSIPGALCLVLIKLEMLLELPLTESRIHGYPQTPNLRHIDDIIIDDESKMQDFSVRGIVHSLDNIDQAIHYLYAVVKQGVVALDNNTVDICSRGSLSPHKRRLLLEEIEVTLKGICDSHVSQMIDEIKSSMTNHIRCEKKKSIMNTSSLPILYSLVVLMSYVSLLGDVLYSGDDESVVVNVFDSVIHLVRSTILSSIHEDNLGRLPEGTISLSSIKEEEYHPNLIGYLTLVERFHCAKISLLAVRMQLLSRFGISMKSLIIEKAIKEGLHDFPLNRDLLVMIIHLDLKNVAGNLKMRDYLSLVEDREHWGGGSQPVEKLMKMVTEILFTEQRIFQVTTANESWMSTTSSNWKKENGINNASEQTLSRPALEVELHRRLISIIDNSMEDPRCRAMPIVWRVYINSCLYLASNDKRENAYLSTAKRAFYRGLRHCAGCKDYFVSSIISLRSVGLLSAAEIDQILDVMHKRGLMLRSLNVP